eukprot:3802918-Rhodomonas_salina.3
MAVHVWLSRTVHPRRHRGGPRPVSSHSDPPTRLSRLGFVRPASGLEPLHLAPACIAARES